MRSVRDIRELAAALVILVGCAHTAQASDYRLDTGDRLQIKVQGWPEIAGELGVAADGAVPIAGIGNVMARGFTTGELAEKIAGRLKASSPSGPPPIAAIEILRHRPVFVLGDVQKPGDYEYQPKLTVMKAVSLAGGFYRPPIAGFQRFERDSIVARGELAAFDIKATRLRVRLARLEAELRGDDELTIPEEITSKTKAPGIAEMLREARGTLSTNRAVLAQRIKGYNETKDLLEQEIRSLTLQISAETRQLHYVNRELDKLKGLAERGLASSPRMLDLERNVAQITGTRQALETSIIRARQELLKQDQRILEVREEAASRLRTEIDRNTAELDEADARRKTNERLIIEAELAAPQAFLLSESERRHHRFVIVRQRNGEKQELTADPYAEMQPGDLLEIERILGGTDLIGAAAPAAVR